MASLTGWLLQTKALIILANVLLDEPIMTPMLLRQKGVLARAT